MNDYEKVLLILSEFATKKAKYNKLVKLRIQTEDESLLELLRPVIKYYQHSLHLRSHDEQEAFGDLMEYCNDMNNKRKPQWQILAERNGWAKQ